MKRISIRAVPPRATLAIVALALIAGAVTGGERHLATPAAEAQLPAAPAALEPVQGGDDVLIETRQRAPRTANDLFAAASWTPKPPPAPSPAPVVVPRPPEAPALPYKYSGRFVKGGEVVVYLLRQDELLLVQAGSVIGADYRVDAISERQISFTYLPLGLPQFLDVPQAP